MVQTKAEATRQKILDACEALVLEKGFSATSVDDICRTAGLTKGGFFYHYSSKENAGKAVMERWSAQGEEMMASAIGANPVETLFNCIDLMIFGATESGGPAGCVVGEISQEAGPSNEVLAEVAANSFNNAQAKMEQLITDAAEHLGVEPDFEGEFARMAWSLPAAFQGAMVLARAKRDTGVVAVVLEDYKRSLRARLGIAE